MSDKCDEYREKIAGILAGEVDAVDAEAVEKHMLECPDCRRFHQDLLQDDRMLNEFVRSADDEVTRLEALVMNNIENAVADRAPARWSVSRGAGWFQSPLVKLAAAATVIAAIIIGANVVDRSGGSNMAWANMMKQVDEAQDYICRAVQTNSADTGGELNMVYYMSRKYGLRADIYRDDELQAAMYMKPTSNTLYTFIHRDRTYTMTEMTDEERRQMLEETSARSLVKNFESSTFKEIGTDVIDGKTVSGIEVVDPPEYAGAFDECTLRLWVDTKTNWPAKIEFEATARKGNVRVKRIMADFQWNPSLSKADFEFEIPRDYELLGKMGAPKKDQKSAVDGLRTYARLTGGSYPSVLSYATAVYEVEEAMNDRDTGSESVQDYFDELAKVGNACAFYGELLEDNADPKYYGDRIGSRDYDKVLMRWRLEDGKYRVIYGDLRTEDVSAGRLAELEEK
ncbi:MAG: zf-HC2 domain-containing protein [Candidatus Latescibacterota bacterium]|jgi:outer membrane lipoprotein-sorting protein